MEISDKHFFSQWILRRACRSATRCLVDDVQGSTTLDLVTSVLVGDDDATFRWVARAITTVDQEARATAHAVGGGWEQLVAVWHTLVSEHVSKGVGSWWQWADTDLASARRVVSAGTRLTRAATSGVNPRSIISSAREVVSRDVIGVWTTSGDVQISWKKKNRKLV
jgi:hypothetical protein